MSRIITILAQPEFDTNLIVRGWVKTKRSSKNVTFVNLNDGSTIKNLQIVLAADRFSQEIIERITSGASILAKGKLIQSQGSGQNIELLAEVVEVLGDSPADLYPLQPKEHSMEFLREVAHLRMRTSTFSAVMRIRHHLAFAVHKFFNQQGFFYLHTPIITASDCEGAGELFSVTTIDPANPPRNELKQVDYSQDFFGRQAKLTVSGQLEAELGALALGQVYTFGPTFRAENSNTARHLAEFWMIEPEVAFNELADNILLAENLLKFLLNYALEFCQDDLAFLDQRFTKENDKKKKEDRDELGLLDKLKFVSQSDFEKITYTEAIEILMQSNPYKKGKFIYPVSWGIDLQSEHERYLVEKHFKKPTVITDYPLAIKAFYMKQNSDQKTVRAMDLLVPGIGEMIGGSQREDNLDLLIQRAKQVGIHEKDLWWYLDTRKFGNVPHSGFGMGFERLMLFVTGMQNIRDVIPFPRTPKSAEF